MIEVLAKTVPRSLLVILAAGVVVEVWVGLLEQDLEL